MTEPPGRSEHAEPFTPPEHADPRQASGELFAHGLLTFLCQDTPQRTEERVGRVVLAIQAGEPAAAPSSAGTLRFPQARRWAALAACFAVVAALVYMGMPTASTAQAMIKASAQALRGPGDRRFEVRIAPRATEQLPATPTGTIDTRGPELVVMRLAPQDNPPITFGRDRQGPWVVLPDGRIDRDARRSAWPRWATVDDQPVSPERVDTLLDELADNYTLTRTSQTEPDGGRLERISGQRRRNAGPGTPQIDVLINATTKTLVKVELRFPEPPTPDGPRSGFGHRPPLEPGERPMRLPLPEDGRREDPSRGATPRPDTESARPWSAPPPGPRDLRRGEPAGPPPEGARPPRHGPGGPPGPGGPRRPPALIELRPVEPPALPDSWFTPQGHTQAGAKAAPPV